MGVFACVEHNYKSTTLANEEKGDDLRVVRARHLQRHPAYQYEQIDSQRDDKYSGHQVTLCLREVNRGGSGFCFGRYNFFCFRFHKRMIT